MRFLSIITFFLAATLCNVSTFAKTILFLGDSLTAGYGLKAEFAFPAIVEKNLKQNDQQIRVINGGVSGDTTAGGLRRLTWMLKSSPDIVVVALGSNDMLRGISPQIVRSNLEKILQILAEKNIQAALMSVPAAPNLGRKYERDFNKVYSDLSDKFKIPLLKNFLEDVVLKPNLNLADSIHPNAEGHKIIAERVEKFLKDSVL